MSKETYIAATRFGMGLGPATDGYAERSPKTWLASQIEGRGGNLGDFNGLASAKENAAKLIAAKKSGDKALVQELKRGFKDVFKDEIRAKVIHAINTPTPFYERLVDFWSNHFTVSIRKGGTVALAGAFEREAIRPNILGNFSGMLLAVTRHPAMLIYLDNAQSIGPDSLAGMRTQKGLNENLAREIMELHTLGVDGGYTQQDVTTFAKVLTGWSLGNDKQGEAGDFFFFPKRHEPGSETLLGKTYGDDGEQQGVEVLQDLAIHPATAHHIAFKLARHFIADEPPQAAVDALAANFRQTRGNLTALYQTLLALPDSWTLAKPKMKSSYDLVISAARLTEARDDMLIGWCLQSLKFLGNAPLTANSPVGFPDTVRDIAGPEAVMRRIEWAQGAGGKLAGGRNYMELAELSIAPIMGAQTRDVLGSAHNEHEGLALLFGSPEFQRR